MRQSLCAEVRNRHLCRRNKLTCLCALLTHLCLLTLSHSYENKETWRRESLRAFVCVTGGDKPDREPIPDRRIAT